MATKTKAKAKATTTKEDLKKTEIKEELKAEVRNLEIPTPRICKLKCRIGGDSLISNRMSDKAEQDFEDIYVTKVQSKPKGSLVPPRKPEDEWEGSLHVINKSKKIYGFPALGIKECIVRAFDGSGIYMTIARRLFDVIPQHPYEGRKIPELVKIDYEHIEKRRDRVVMNGTTPSLAYRCQFINWTADLEIQFDADIISVNQLLPFIVKAGFSVGIGCWSKMKKGSHGLFSLHGTGELTEVFDTSKSKFIK